MLTALHIKETESNSAFQRVFSSFRRNSVKVRIKENSDVQVKIIEVVKRRKALNWSKLDKYIGAQRNRLLCDAKTKLPKGRSYKRFFCDDYKHQLCINLSISLLSSLNDCTLKVGFVDMKMQFDSVINYLLKYIDTLTVITEKTDEYMEIADQLLEETGAPLRISKSTKALANCDLVIAPNGLYFDFIPKHNAVILTDRAIDKAIDCIVIHDYDIVLPKDIDSLCPEFLNRTYFASALYCVEKMYQLGSLIPSMCLSSNSVLTISSLKNQLKKLSDKS